MLKTIKFIFQAVAYGLALALLVLLVFPQYRPAIWQETQEKPDQPQHLSFADAVKRAAPAVVWIRSERLTAVPRFKQRQQRTLEDLGSGVIMSENGYVLTNYHVINNADLVFVTLLDGREFSAQLIGLDTETDLALLKIDAQHLPVIPTDDSFKPQVGDVVLAIGNPLNLGQTITQGIISATENLSVGSIHSPLLQMDAAINIGNSGGALVNSNGTLVGINSAAFTSTKNRDIQGIFFAIPYSLAASVMEELIKNGRVIRGYAGFSGEPISSSYTPVVSNAESVAGMRVTDVDPLGPAWQAGLIKGDIVVRINEQPIESVQKVLGLVATTPPGKDLILDVVRNRKLIRLNLTIAELKKT